MQVMKTFADLQERNESVGTQHESADDSGGDNDSQTRSSDVDDIQTLIDKIEGNSVIVQL